MSSVLIVGGANMPEAQKIDQELHDDKYKIELLYKNFDSISHAYFSGEQIFPLWEAVYALIEGQLLVAFFTANNGNGKILIAFTGIIFSFIWFKVITLSFHYSRYRSENLLELEDILEKEYNKIRFKLPGNSNFKFYKIVSKPKKKGLRMYLSTSWLWRRGTPVIIIVVWLILAAISHYHFSMLKS